MYGTSQPNNYLRRIKQYGHEPNAEQPLIDKAFIKRNRIKEVPELLKNGHTLNSIDQSVILRFIDRPNKLRNHLPY